MRKPCGLAALCCALFPLFAAGAASDIRALDLDAIRALQDYVTAATSTGRTSPGAVAAKDRLRAAEQRLEAAPLPDASGRCRCAASGDRPSGTSAGSSRACATTRCPDGSTPTPDGPRCVCQPSGIGAGTPGGSLPDIPGAPGVSQPPGGSAVPAPTGLPGGASPPEKPPGR